MPDITIKTNHVPRDVIYGFELSPKDLAKFDYKEDPENAEFFRYRGQVYDLGEFLHTRSTRFEQFWDGYHSDSFFSGILIRYVDDYERVIVATYCS